MAVSKKTPKIKREAPKVDAADAPKPSKREVKAERKEKLSKTGKIILVAIGIAAMLLSVTAMACSGVLNEVSNQKDYELTGGVAATVNGVNIKEDTITEQIMSLRTSAYEKDEDWATYLAEQGLTPESYRENAINSIARQYLLAQAEKEYDVTVSQEDLDKAWEDAVEGYGQDEKAFEEYIGQMGFDKTSYLEAMKGSLAQQKLREAVAPAKKVSGDEVMAYLNENSGTYTDMRRSSHILFKVAEDATDEERAKVEADAQKVLDQINVGEIEFAEAAKKHSEDTSAKDGGDVGWDKLTTFVTEYQDALTALSTGQVSGLVKTTYGYHIIQCTEQFSIANAASVDDVPKDIVKTVKEQIKSSEQGAAYTEWLNGYVEKADIQINEMPENVPYNVDMSKAKAEDSE